MRCDEDVGIVSNRFASKLQSPSKTIEGAAAYRRVRIAPICKSRQWSEVLESSGQQVVTQRCGRRGMCRRNGRGEGGGKIVAAIENHVRRKS
jgi:hypothetical protein